MKKRILLADDSLTIQKVVELSFMDESFEVDSVGTGDDAITSLEAGLPSIVIADVHMPGASGYQVCRRAKELDSALPVLLLVGTFEALDEDEVVACGADGQLKKPFDSQELLQLVQGLTSGEAMPAADGESAGDAEPEASVESLTDAVPDQLLDGDTDTAGDDEAAVGFDFGSGLPTPAMESTEASDGAEIGDGFELEPSLEIEESLPEISAPDGLPSLAMELGLDDPQGSTNSGLPDELVASVADDAFADASEPLAEDVAAADSAADEGGRSIDSANDGAGATLSDDDVDRIARRVVEQLGADTVREVAWDVIPDLAEIVIKDRIRELEAEVD